MNSRIPWTEEPGGMGGHKELDTTELTWHAKISTVPTENMIFKAEEQDAFPLK